MNLLRYWHTVRHLRPEQIYGRLRFRISRPRVDLAPPPDRRAGISWRAGAERAPSLIGPSRLRLLGRDVDLDSIGWDSPTAPKLLRYNLHYFDDCASTDAETRATWQAALIDRWIGDNPPAIGTGWEPYPTSLRMVNWIKRDWSGQPLNSTAVHSLAVQARSLASRVETHLLGNHLLTNAKALTFAGLYFTGDEAAAWLRTGSSILAAQIPEQILEDGGHFERSPMYHALVLEDLLDLCNACMGCPETQSALSAQEAEWRHLIPPMLSWLDGMTHPDGDVGHFNDSSLAFAPTLASLSGYARRLGIEAVRARLAVSVFRQSGYVRLDLGPAVALLDVGPVGPDYLPAHAHADTLSFELSLFGTRALVNSGTSTYETGPERLRQRGTLAHNTVTVDQADSSEVWSSFRVARRARPFDLTVTDGAAPTIGCAHDGYRRLPGGPVHRRAWHFGPGRLSVSDRIEGSFRSAQARFHFHPSLVVDVRSPAETRLTLPGGHRVKVLTAGGNSRLEPSTWHPSFGVSVPNQCLAVDLTGPELRTTIEWPAE